MNMSINRSVVRRRLNSLLSLPLVLACQLSDADATREDAALGEAEGGGNSKDDPSQVPEGEGGEGGSGGQGDGAGGGTGGAGDDGSDEPAPDDSGSQPEGEDTGTTGEPACNDVDPVALYLSPDDSNSMSSPVQLREAVLSGWSSPQAVAIRPWEFFNYYRFDYPAAPAGTVTVTPSLSHDAKDPDGEYLLQIGVSSEAVGENRPPINLVLVLDTSGSMSGTPMEMLKHSCHAISDHLREGDTISMVRWDTSNQVVLQNRTVAGPGDAMVGAAIDGLEASGGTDLSAGLQAGYDLANAVYDPSRINRIVLISDGGANVGVTDIDLIAAQASKSGEDGIYMVGVGVGDAGSYHDDLMDQVTDAGKGASVFIGSAAEATKVFGDRFTSTLSVAVRDVQVRVDLPPGFEIVTFSGEEYSSDPTEIEPQHLAPDDAMVFHQRIASCAPDGLSDETPITVTARFEEPLTGTPHEVSVTATIAELLATDQSQLRKGAAILAYTDAIKAWKLAEDDSGREAALAPALAELDRARQLLPEDADLLELGQVLGDL